MPGADSWALLAATGRKLPCFAVPYDPAEALQQRLKPHLREEVRCQTRKNTANAHFRQQEWVEFAIELIRQAYSNFRTGQYAFMLSAVASFTFRTTLGELHHSLGITRYDMYQYWTNRIHY